MDRETEWQQAGLYDPATAGAADRLELLEYLDELGCELDEMVEAHRRGRLFALSGDRIVRPWQPRYDCASAASAVGLDPETVAWAWRSFGLPTPAEPVLGDLDLDALRTWLRIRDLFGQDAAVALARVLGSGVARLAEAESAALRAGLQVLDVGRTGSEVVTARAYAD